MIFLPWVLAAVGAAFFSNACTPQEQNLAPQTPHGDTPPEPKDSQENYPVDFAADSTAAEIYQALYQAGVKLKDLDRGCYSMDWAQSESKGTIKDNAGTIEGCEVFEYALDHSQDHPALAKRLADGVPPWELDDQNPATDFDAKVRTRAQNAIAQLKNLLIRQGLKPDSPEYQEKLAEALYYFAAYPLDPSRDPGVKNWQFYGKKELFASGLEEFHRETLLKSGGLGRISSRAINLTQEYSALQTIEKNEGWCTEWSKVLYGVLVMAGLKPFFAYTQIDPAALPSPINDPELKVLDHIFLGLPLGSRTRLFDLSLYQPDSHHPRFQRLHLRHYLSVDFSNRGVEAAKMDGNLTKAKALFQRSLELDPNNPLSRHNLSQLSDH